MLMQPSGVFPRCASGSFAAGPVCFCSSVAFTSTAEQLPVRKEGGGEGPGGVGVGGGDGGSDETDELLIRVSISRPSVGIHFISPLLPLPPDAGAASQHALLRGLFNNVVGETKQERGRFPGAAGAPLCDIYPGQGPSDVRVPALCYATVLTAPALWRAAALLVRRGKSGQPNGKGEIREPVLPFPTWLLPPAAAPASLIPPPAAAPPVLRRLGVPAGGPPHIYHTSSLLQLGELPECHTAGAAGF